MNEAGKVLNLGTEELNRLLETYLNTSGMSRLSSGYIGDRAHPAAGELHQSVLNSTRFVLQLCAEHGGLVPGYRKQGTWAIPEVPTLPMCGGKRLHLVVVTHLNVKPGYKMTEGMLGSFKMRGIPLPGYMVRSGHEASWWSEGEHLQLFQACLNGTNDTPPFPEPQAAAKRGVHVVGLVIKTRPTPLVACLQKYKVPVVLDLVDGALDNLTNYQGYDLILATNRLAADILSANTGVHSVPLYHQPANYERFHRADRSRPVKVIGMTHAPEYNNLGTAAMAAALDKYCIENNVTLRRKYYVGHGFDQQELMRYMSAKHDLGHQLGYSMGLSSVDIAVLWLPCDVVELICLKPTTRLALFLSLGIPVVFKATASYTDIVALSGYPFIAHNVSHAMKLVDMLVKDASLRQAASELGLKIAERFHLDNIGQEFERAMCSVVG